MQLTSDLAAVVTGGASGLGHAVATALRAAEVKVTLIDQDAEKGEARAKELGATFAEADVTSAESVANALQVARAANGPERLCINCAGIAPAAKTVGRNGVHDLALFQSVINVNLVGSFNVASQSAAGMVEEGTDATCAGVIINTASIAAYEGQIGQVAYAASKAVSYTHLTLPTKRIV